MCSNIGDRCAPKCDGPFFYILSLVVAAALFAWLLYDIDRDEDRKMEVLLRVLERAIEASAQTNKVKE